MEHAENCVLPLCVKEPAAALCPFYTDRRVIAAFKTYISRLLNHVNAYTGRALKDEPAIMGWEVRHKCPHLISKTFACVNTVAYPDRLRTNPR